MVDDGVANSFAVAAVVVVPGADRAASVWTAAGAQTRSHM